MYCLCVLVSVLIFKHCLTSDTIFCCQTLHLASSRDPVEVSAVAKRHFRTGSVEAGSVWSSDRDRVGTQALVELGVSTGLGLLFALLKQTWALAVRVIMT